MKKLIIDIGNTSINFALFVEDNIDRKTSTRDKDKYSLEYFMSFIYGFLGHEKIDDIYISSVFPNVAEFINKALDKLYPDIIPFFISPKSKTNLEYNVDDPNEIGADIIGDLAMGKKKYGYPLLIADLGTATKILLIDKNGNFKACNILPGLTLSLRSLAANAALLPDIKVSECNSVLASNTIDAMNSGVIYSHIGGIEYIFDCYEKELGYKCKKIFTGGAGMKIKVLLGDKYDFDEDLLLEGINYLGDLAR